MTIPNHDKEYLCPETNEWCPDVTVPCNQCIHYFDNSEEDLTNAGEINESTNE